MSNKPILCIDFDGVIHKYSKGWQGGLIYDDVTEGFFDWAEKAKEVFALVIYSSRSGSYGGIDAMKHWLKVQGEKWAGDGDGSGAIPDVASWFDFASEKPPAFLTIDDRAVCFEGKWDGIAMDPFTLRHFKPWTQGVPA
jgi:hypothetical protein